MTCDRPARVLLVEDETRLARMVQRGLQHAGFDVDVVHDGMAALTACQEDGPDLMVLDIGIPRPDGLTVLRTLREEGDQARSCSSPAAAASRTASPGSEQGPTTTCPSPSPWTS